MIMLMLASLAHGGKLADGYRGLAWGIYEQVPKPPGSCIADPDAMEGIRGVPWYCDQTIGSVPVGVYYMWEHQRLYSVMIKTKGFVQCDTLMDTLIAAWGRPSPSASSTGTDKLDGKMWLDTEVGAVWSYNEWMHECNVVLLHRKLYAEVEKARAAAARRSVDDL
jgi:hypothetical protein